MCASSRVLRLDFWKSTGRLAARGLPSVMRAALAYPASSCSENFIKIVGAALTQKMECSHHAMRQAAFGRSLVGRTVAGHAQANLLDLFLRQKRRFPDLEAAVILPRDRFDLDRKPHGFRQR